MTDKEFDELIEFVGTDQTCKMLIREAYGKVVAEMAKEGVN